MGKNIGYFLIVLGVFLCIVSLLEERQVLIYELFAIAKICRISHDHQAPFALSFLLLEIEQWLEAKTSCH